MLFKNRYFFCSCFHLFLESRTSSTHPQFATAYHWDTRLLWVLPGGVFIECNFWVTFSKFTGAGSKVSAAENLANLFPGSQLNTRNTTSWFCVLLSGTDIHAQPRYKTPVDRPLRKPYITCARVKKILKLKRREVRGYVNGLTGFGNMWFVFKMSEPVPAVPVWTFKSSGGSRPRYLVQCLAPSFKIRKKSIGIFWLFQDFIALRFLNEI